jgi:DNA-directed RNA polymerase specialized sigma24 family protein
MDTVEAIELAPPGSRTREALVAELDGHGPMLLAAARVITLDTAEAEDLVQTTFEIALRRLGDLREPRAIRAWLLTIQTREAFRVVRRLRNLVIALHHLAGLSVAETARALGVSENTVKSQLKTGLGRLREELRDG